MTRCWDRWQEHPQSTRLQEVQYKEEEEELEEQEQEQEQRGMQISLRLQPSVLPMQLRNPLITRKRRKNKRIAVLLESISD